MRRRDGSSHDSPYALIICFHYRGHRCAQRPAEPGTKKFGLLVADAPDGVTPPAQWLPDCLRIGPAHMATRIRWPGISMEETLQALRLFGREVILALGAAWTMTDPA